MLLSTSLTARRALLGALRRCGWAAHTRNRRQPPTARHAKQARGQGGPNRQAGASWHAHIMRGSPAGSPASWAWGAIRGVCGAKGAAIAASGLGPRSLAVQKGCSRVRSKGAARALGVGLPHLRGIGPSMSEKHERLGAFGGKQTTNRADWAVSRVSDQGSGCLQPATGREKECRREVAALAANWAQPRHRRRGSRQDAARRRARATPLALVFAPPPALAQVQPWSLPRAPSLPWAPAYVANPNPRRPAAAQERECAGGAAYLASNAQVPFLGDPLCLPAACRPG